MALLIVLLLLLVGLAYNFWRSQQETIYELEVINQSGVTVDQVKLFGSGVQDGSTLKGLKPGRSAIISVMLKTEGGLKFEVQQGRNRIDTFIDKDINAIASFEQQLVIHPNNRFLISDYDELSISN